MCPVDGEDVSCSGELDTSVEACPHEMLEVGSGSLPLGDTNADQGSDEIDKGCQTPAGLRKK